MLTSVLSERTLSKKQIVKFYKMRWGIEIEFRGLKQTLDSMMRWRRRSII
jgi:transposase